MSGCQTCGGYGMKHDPTAHDAEPQDMTHWSILGYTEHGVMDGLACRCEIGEDHVAGQKPWLRWSHGEELS